MADTQEIPWGEIAVDETVTEADQAASDDISNKTMVGWALCTVSECTAFENVMKTYTCNAANLKLIINSLIKIEQPVIDDNGQPVKRNGEVIQKIMDIPADKLVAMNALYAGRFIFDTINLQHPLEKDGMRNRRLFVAKRLGLITPTSTVIPAMAWAGAAGKQVIVKTEWNLWKDKITEEINKNVKVAWDGYDYASSFNANGTINTGPENNTGSATTGAGSADTETFDI